MTKKDSPYLEISILLHYIYYVKKLTITMRLMMKIVGRKRMKTKMG